MPDLNFENALEAAPCGVLVFAHCGQLVFANSMGRKIFMSQDREQNQEFNLLDQEHLFETGDMERIRQAFSGRNVEISALCVKPLPDSEFWLHCVFSPNLSAENQVETVTVYAYDISQYRQLEYQLMEEMEFETELANHLNRAQRQLQQSEKLATVGQLAAGIAHEINNPIGYIGSNINTMKSYLDKILPVFDQSKQILGSVHTHSDKLDEDTFAKLEDVKALIDGEEFNYMQNDLAELIAECAEGIERVKNIVADMKNFSRQGDDEKEMTDIHDAIDTALNIAKNEIKYKAVVKKSYADLPKIFCSPSQMNQIFLNILVNAAQAISDHGTIRIKTESCRDVVQIEIADDGAGMDEKELSKIFDTFYTTKPVGEGTGLGLPIARDIITRHGGEINVRSALGEGTCFEIRLPVTQQGEEQKYIESAS